MKFISTIAILFFCCILNANDTISNKNVSFEIGGSGLGFSFNYEKALFYKTNKTFYYRIGTGYFPLIVNDKFSAGTVDLLLGTGCTINFGNHNIESGIINIFALSIDNMTKDNRYTKTSYMISPNLGYRNQNTFKRHFFYKFGYSPILSFRSVAPGKKAIYYNHHFYIGIGLSFK